MVAFLHLSLLQAPSEADKPVISSTSRCCRWRKITITSIWEIPFEQLSKEVQQAVLYGSARKITFTYLNECRAHQQVHPFRRYHSRPERWLSGTESQTVREELAKIHQCA
ncbi:MAG: hypothetical protein P0107_01515 [Nitrosomonas sp.]|nr:hypothetical protein [Nitrosomonas sp.]